MPDVENTFYLFLETLHDDIELESRFLYNAEKTVHVIKSKRDGVPKVEGYVLNVVQLMSDPKHIDDFKVHFRLSRDLYIFILNEVFVVLQRNGHGPKATVLPDKQLLGSLWYLANTTSMREVAHLFGLSIATVHGIIKDVYKAIGQLSIKVSYFTPKQFVELYINRSSYL